MEGKLGQVATWEIGADGKARLVAQHQELVKASVEVDIVELLRLAAKQSDNKIDDSIVEMVALAFARV